MLLITIGCENDTNHCIACVAFLFSEIFCDLPPPPPEYGGYAFTGSSFGDTVTYDCECGFDLEGPQTLTCGKTGDWGIPPCCRSESD